MSEQTKHKAVSGKYTKKGTPNGVTSITPFITVKDPSEAIHFYKVVFNARVKDITEHPDGNGNTIIGTFKNLLKEHRERVELLYDLLQFPQLQLLLPQ